MDGDQLVSRKRDNHSGTDFLSDLPLSIIHCILELIPIWEVVRTCILSRQWRYIWTTLPNLVFEVSGALFDWKDLKTFITNVLLLHKGPIHKFRIVYYLAPKDVAYIDNWLLFLSSNEIRGLLLGAIGFKLYSFQKLTHLELHKCLLPSPHPTFKGFPCLRSLVLHGVRVSSKTVESLVANSPLLEKFTMSTEIHFESLELRIIAPNLKCFDLRGEFEEISLYAPLVAEVSVAMDQEEDVFAAKHESSVCNFTKFLGGFTNLERLTGYWYFTKYLSIGIKSYDHSLVFHHLQSIHLYCMSFEDVDQLAVVRHLMMGAPNLTHLSISPNICIPESRHTSYSGFGCGPNLAFNKLRFIKMDDLRYVPCEMEIIKYLLKSSPVLETMDLESYYELDPEVKSSMMAELLSYSRASPNAKVDVQ